MGIHLVFKVFGDKPKYKTHELFDVIIMLIQQKSVDYQSQ